MGDPPAADDGADGDVREESWTLAEKALLEAALDFYAAAGGVIDLANRDRPQLRRGAPGFDAVRRAMGALEHRVVAAHAAGAAPERIAEIARIETETIELILERRAAAPNPDEG